MLWFTLLLACGPSEVECAPGFVPVDGVCYQDGSESTDDTDEDDTEDPDDTGLSTDTAVNDTAIDDTGLVDTGGPLVIQDILDQLTACNPLPSNQRLDLIAACADGACPGYTFGQINAAVNEVGTCSQIITQYGTTKYARVDCDWSIGMSAYFNDADEDGVPDNSSQASTLYLTIDYDGTTTDGLGNGAELGCFIQAFGYPDGVDFELNTNGQFEVQYMSFRDQWNFAIADYYDNSTGSYGGDGKVDRFTLYP